MTIDLTKLPPPQVVEQIDYELLLSERKRRLISAVPDEMRRGIEATLAIESEPLTMLLQESAYAEFVLRARINDAARATMLAYAQGADLDNLVVLLDVERLEVAPANPDATPPAEKVMESDERLRYRAQMSLEGLSVAGSIDAYRFHTLSADAGIADAAVDSPTPGVVRVAILGETGVATPAQVAAVAAALNAKRVRPLTDTVKVEAARVVVYSLRATVTIADGPDRDVVLADIRQRAAQTAIDYRAIGRGVPRSALYAALHGAGVLGVSLTMPAADMAADPLAAYQIGSIEIGVAA
ncbi:baseplate J/gp47 family protein [Craterilacuibacter sp. RT1T]|uniref:baseplate assembly protein n=1 Tax=Craterilacuibacter sp. RT1T TaxID=2942211 RepID=UPI0020C017E8|nr:baseplate J/gp47 family protein [Craterilacuibacter sp. RT1T]MCL6262176.1 baseplate J/gp47 family protein [Craterilacuibacter sp. RT1T]